MNAVLDLQDTAEMTPVRFVGRQPILDRTLKLYGHELLFRQGTDNFFTGEADHAAKSVIDNSLLLIPESNQERFFVNCTKQVVMSKLVTMLPPDRAVLEILETVVADDEFLGCCKELKEQGYRFALDDYSPTEALTPLIGIADIIKIDFLATDKQGRRQIYEQSRGSKIKFLAEKLETEADFEQARKEGCELFQGYFFCKPIMIPARAIPQSKLIYLQLLAELSKSDPDIARVEELVMSDTSICYRLLRLVNSALYGLPEPVSSIRHALLRIGENEFQKLVTLALVNAATSSNAKAASRIALERAKFCELLAPFLHEAGSTLYLLGLLSLVDVILGMTMIQVMDSLPLSPRLKDALLPHGGDLRIVIDLVREREAGHAERVDELQARMGLPTKAAAAFHAAAVQWADKVSMLG